MPKTDDQSIAEVYAQSLLELATTQNAADAIDEEFSDFAAYLDLNPDFLTFLTSRVVEDDARRDSLEKIFRGRMSELLLNTLQVLNNKHRIELVREVQRQYHEQLLQQKQQDEVYVTTATPLSGAQRDKVRSVMEARLGRKVILLEHVDPHILGGLMIRVHDQKIDRTVSHQLRRFMATMVDHAKRHIHAGTNLFEGGEIY